MNVERETVYQLALAGGAVLLFIAAAMFVGTSYGTNGNLTTQGGFVLVGTIAAFVVLMVAVGFFLERREFESE